MSSSVIVCLAFYLVITLSSDVAVFYQPSGSSQSTSLQNAAAFGVEHGREIPFPLAQTQPLPDAARNPQYLNDRESNRPFKESPHLQKVESAHRKKHVRRPSLANVRAAQTASDPVPVFYPPESLLAASRPAVQEKHFAHDTLPAIALTHDTGATTISAILGLLTAVAFSVAFILCGSNEVRRKWKGFKLRRMREHEIRSR